MKIEYRKLPKRNRGKVLGLKRDNPNSPVYVRINYRGYHISSFGNSDTSYQVVNIPFDNKTNCDTI